MMHDINYSDDPFNFSMQLKPDFEMPFDESWSEAFVKMDVGFNKVRDHLVRKYVANKMWKLAADADLKRLQSCPEQHHNDALKV